MIINGFSGNVKNIGISEAESFAKVMFSDLWILYELGGKATSEDLAFRHYVGPISDAKGLPYIMVSDQYSDAVSLKMQYYPTNIVNGQGVNSSKWLVEKNKPGLSRKASCDLDPPALTT